MGRRFYAILFLVLISPAIAELLSSSSPPIEFFNPFSLLYLTTFYGFGALLIREIRILKDMDYISILFLGFAYGVIEEGITVKSFFNPTWPDLGILSWYGRLYGVNWIWLIALTAYHGLISVFIPIAMTDIIFSDLKDYPLIQGRKKLFVITSIFVFDIILFNIGFMGWYSLDFVYYFLCIVMIFIFYLFARKIIVQPIYKPGNAYTAWFIGLIWMLLFYIIYFGLPHFLIPPFIVAIIGILHTYFALRYYSIVKIDEINESIKLASLIGPPSFFILLSPFIEMDKARSDNPVGMTLTGIVFAFIFYIMYRKVSSRKSRG